MRILMTATSTFTEKCTGSTRRRMSRTFHFHFKLSYGRTAMSRTPMEPLNFVRDRGGSS